MIRVYVKNNSQISSNEKEETKEQTNTVYRRSVSFN